MKNLVAFTAFGLSLFTLFYARVRCDQIAASVRGVDIPPVVHSLPAPVPVPAPMATTESPLPLIEERLLVRDGWQRPNDVPLTVNGVVVRSWQDVDAQLAERKNETVRVVVRRPGKPMRHAAITLERRLPEHKLFSRAGPKPRDYVYVFVREEPVVSSMD